ncbi:hypothetical protein HR065_00495 [Candidatus Phytoplasma pruni]|uniref:Uncharacterized protein n=1 Tax=Candidatus Phytoplasma pruni TaxID=479893 RepID=A0A851HH11_9MOLU|nr:hypothetical protein [Candidatus Phytoplasma pruni]
MSRLKQYLKTSPKKFTLFAILSITLLSVIIITAYNLIPYFLTTKTEKSSIPIQANQHELTHNDQTIINSTQQQTFEAINDDTTQNPRPGDPNSDKINLTPYLTYQDQDGNTIREYRFFDNMEPTQKDIRGRENFFNRTDFQNMIDKYKLNAFPLKWNTGRENLFNLEFNEQQKVKMKYGWPVSQANYQLIQTNQPYNTIESLTKDIQGENGFWNKSDSCFNTTENIDIQTIINDESYKGKTPYIRFITKNLDLEFDWLSLIIARFNSYLPNVAKAQQTYLKTEYWAEKGLLANAEVQRLRDNIKQVNDIVQKIRSSNQRNEEQIQKATDSALPAKNDIQNLEEKIRSKSSTNRYNLDSALERVDLVKQIPELQQAIKAKAFIKQANEFIQQTRSKISENNVHIRGLLADSERFNNEMQEHSKKAKQYQEEAVPQCYQAIQQHLQKAKTNGEPTFNPSLIQKTIISGPKKKPTEKDLIDISYQLSDFTNFIKNLDLATTDDLYTLRAYVLYNTDNDVYDPHNALNHLKPTFH